MKIMMIRHGEADYTGIDEKNFIGFGRDLAPLKTSVINDVSEMAKDKRLLEAEIIISSPITRAMHTAAFISRETGLDIDVNINLHEWLPDVTQQYGTAEESFKLYKDFMKNEGVHTKGDQVWETLESLQTRVRKAFNMYYGKYNTVIIVSHSLVCKVFCDTKNIGYGEIVEFEYMPDTEYAKWF